MITEAVTLSQLRVLVAVVDEGGIGRAAHALGLAQSAVSQHLASLERNIGEPLLVRRAGPVRATPTATATMIVAHGRAILERLEVLGADVLEMRDGGARRVRLGCFMSVGARILPPLLARLAEGPEAVDVELIERDSDDDLVDQVADCTLDLAFASLPLPDGPFTAVELLADPHVLLLPADHPLAQRRRAPRLDELAELALIGFRNGLSEERRVDGILRSGGREPRVVLRTDNNLAIPELVAVGLGCAILPRLALPDSAADPRLRVIDLPAATVPPRRIGLFWHSERRLSPAAATVRDITRDVCRELSAPNAREPRRA
jgi:DNA-binding transcriptional LysR family regulator